MTDARTLLEDAVGEMRREHRAIFHPDDFASTFSGKALLAAAAEADTLRQRVAALEGLVAFEVIPALKVFAGDNRGVRSLVKRLEALNPTPDR